MAKTVIEAFNTFLKDFVNIDSAITTNARSSRDWLLDQIHLLPDKDTEFPVLYSEKDICYGSFARRTKIRELDDIDIMIAFSGQGNIYNEKNDHIEICVPDSVSQLKNMCHDNTNILNSRKLINKLINSLSLISQYQKSEMHRNQEAATLKLLSYTWNFDIVPCFFTIPDIFNKTYYLIPDGNGHWKKTDPRIDRDRVTEINQKHDGNVLNVIRIIKYWNKRPTMPTMGSYLLENMILNYYESKEQKASSFVDLEISSVLSYINNNIMNAVYDPKGIQGDLNKLSLEERNKIKDRTYKDFYKVHDARKLENDKDYEGSINKWIEIFGDNFPKYE